MLTFLRRKRASLLFAFIVLIACSSPKVDEAASVHEHTEPAVEHADDIIALPYLEVDTFNILSKKKLKLTAEYNKENYGFESYRLDTPRIIVVHYTAINKLDASLNTFAPDQIAPSREYIKDFSSLNVGIHYVVDLDGKILNLMPDTVVARHVIGFNHVSLGIENVANDSTDLTDAQIESNAKLIRFLVTKYPTIEFIFGHHEYAIATLPHFKYFRELNPNYEFSGKIDPGPAFMSKLREKLAADGVVREK